MLRAIRNLLTRKAVKTPAEVIAELDNVTRALMRGTEKKF